MSFDLNKSLATIDQKMSASDILKILLDSEIITNRHVLLIQLLSEGELKEHVLTVYSLMTESRDDFYFCEALREKLFEKVADV